MEENNTVIEINQEGQLNGSGPKYRVETNNPQFLGSFIVAFISLPEDARGRIWTHLHDAFRAANRLGICKLEHMKD